MAPFLDSNFYYGTTSTAALFAAAGASGPDYTVGADDPETVADFAGVNNSGAEYYRVAGSETTFDTMFTYSGSSLGTMTDSDGNLKWKPHNYILSSEDWSTNTSTNRVTRSYDQTTSPDGTTTADLLDEGTLTGYHECYQTVSLDANVPWELYCYAKYIDLQYFGVCANAFGPANGSATFDILNGTVARTTASVGYTINSSSITDVGGGWYLCRVNITCTSTITRFATVPLNSTASTAYGAESYTGSNRTVYVWGRGAYRSDLGGMVDNWDQSAGLETYVPTTTAAVYLSRRNHYRYTGASYAKKGILLESAAATNLIVQSNAFTTTWTDTNATPASGAATGPDGETSMWSLVDDGTTGTGEVYLDYSLTGLSTSTAYTFSVFLKANALSWAALGTENFTTPANGESYFNLSTGAKGTAASGHTQNVEEVASGIYRCSITFTTDGTDTTGNVRIYVADADTDNTVDLDGTSSIYVYGAQIETGSVPTSYVPTSGATSTRAAETLTIAGSDMASSTSQMSFQIQGEMNYADNTTSVDGDGASGEVIPYRWYTDASNYIDVALDTDTGGTGGWVWEQEDAGTLDTVSGTSSELSPGVNVAFNIASRHSSSAMNGTSAGTSATENSTPTTLDDLSAANFSVGYKMTGTVGLLRQSNAAWTDSAMQTETS